MPLFSATPDVPVAQSHFPQHTRSRSDYSAPRSDPSMLDPELIRMSSAPSQPTMSSFDQHSHFSQNLGFSRSATPPASMVYDSRFQGAQFRGPFDYPTPESSGFEEQAFSNTGFPSMTTEVSMSPPPVPPPTRGQSYNMSNNRLGESAESFYMQHKRSQSADSPAAADAHSPYQGPPTPYNPFMAMPLTPNSTVGTEDAITRTAPKPASNAYSTQEPDLRRLSVQSLLNNSQGYSPDTQHGRQYPIMDQSTTTYGYDVGHSDLDTPRNDDIRAISIFSPPSGAMELDEDEPAFAQSETRGKDMAFEKGGYYAEPVAIRISKSLEPLPPLLLENPMNLLYFHHFLNHTARILVPHDCEQNPFRQILPESTYIHLMDPSFTDLCSGRPR